MRFLRRALVLIAPLALVATLSAQHLAAELQRARQRETATGDTRAAIAEYKRIATRAGSNHVVAAQALLRMAETYERLGDAQANTTYEEILARFPEQTAIASTARARLSQTRRPVSGLARRRVWDGPDVEGVTTPMAVSADGRYVYHATRDNALSARDLTKGTEATIFRGRADSILVDYRLSRDGKRIALVLVRGERLADSAQWQWQLLVVNRDGSGARTLIVPHINPELVDVLDWSADNTAVLIGVVTLDPAPLQSLLWLKVADNSTTSLVNSPGFMATDAFVSPDGRSIAMGGLRTAGGSREIRLTARDGTGSRTLSANPDDQSPIGWSPDGRDVLITSLRTGVVGLWAIPAGADVKNATAVQIDRDVCGCRAVGSLGMTLTGTWYYSAPRTSSDIHVATLDRESGRASASKALSLPRTGSNAWPLWSPDSKRLAFYWGAAGLRELSVLTADTGAEQRLTGLQLEAGGYCWSGNDALMLKRRRGDRTELTRVDVKARHETTVFEEAATTLVNVTCSAAGRLVAYRVDGAGGMRIRDLAARTVRNVTSSLLLRSSSVYVSHDGSSIAALGSPRDNAGVRGLFVIPVDGGAPRELVRLGSDQQFMNPNGLAWSADSRSIYFSRRELKAPGSESPQFQVFRVPAAGGTEQPVGLTGQDLRDLDISPDGTRIAFSVGPLNRPDVWAMENFLRTK